VNVALELLRCVSVAGEAVTPKKVWSDAYTPKKHANHRAAAILW
jgi:hypothetical protein